MLWEKAYASTLASGCSDVVKSLLPVPEGGFLLSGGTGSVTRTGFLMKLDADGGRLWDRYIENDNGPAYALPTQDGGILAVTRWDEPQAKRVDLLVLKCDREGKVVSTKVLGEPGGRYDVFGVAVSPSGFLVTGYRGFTYLNTDLCVIRLDEEGNAGKPLRAMAPEYQPVLRENVFQPR